MNKLTKLRFNLTLINTLVLIGLTALSVFIISISLNMRQQSELNGTITAYASQLVTNLDGISRHSKDSSQIQALSFLKKNLEKNDAGYLVWDDTFNIAATVSVDGNVSRKALKHLTQRYFNEHHTGYWTVDYQERGGTYKICTCSVVDANGRLAIVQIVRNMRDVQTLSSVTLTAILLVVAIGCGISLAGGFFLSGRALKPIRENLARQQEFLANASHELRTPIAVILTNLEVIKEDRDQTIAEEMQWLDNAYQETKRIQRIVEDLMFLARVDAGETRIEMERIDLAFLSQQVIERMLPLAAQKNILLDWEMPDEALVVSGDRALLTQLIVILLDNAIKYSGENTVVRLIGRRKDTQAALSVIDRGIGIAKSDQNKIFNRFYRVDKTRSRAVGGTGLGLSIAAWIVTQYHGKILVDSEAGQGTTMTVLLPVEKAE